MITMQFIYISLVTLGFEASVVALAGRTGHGFSWREMFAGGNVWWCNCGTKSNGHCIVGPDGSGLECENTGSPNRSIYNVQV